MIRHYIKNSIQKPIKVQGTEYHLYHRTVGRYTLF